MLSTLSKGRGRDFAQIEMGKLDYLPHPARGVPNAIVRRISTPEETVESRAKILGHPIHQMLVPFPFGLLATAAIFDVVQLVSGNGYWSEIAFWMIAAGVIGGLVAAPFGFADWLKIPDHTRARRVGRVHGLGNLAVVVLYAVSWWLRSDAPRAPEPLALALSFAGFALAGLTGWLGGELVDRLGVGVDDGAHLDAPSSLSGHPAATSSSHGARRA